MHHQKEQMKVVLRTVLPFGSPFFIISTPYVTTYVTATNLPVLI